MWDTRSIPGLGAGLVQRWWEALQGYARAATDAALDWRHARGGRPHRTHDRLHHLHDVLLTGRRGRVVKILFGFGVVGCLAIIAVSALWLRLASGPLSLDMLTPRLAAAIEQRLGGRHHVEVGGTQIERTEQGRMAVRLRDIVVRDPDGAVVAVAPKAEVGVSVASLLFGSIQPQRLSLIGAGMAVRIEQDGQITVFAGADQRPIAGPSRAPPLPGGAISMLPPAPASAQVGVAPPATAQGGLAGLLGWLDRLDALGLDGQGLTEIGLKSGTISVDDRRTGKHWEFANIDLSLTRPAAGSVALAVASTGADGPWSLAATLTSQTDGHRLIEAVLRDVSPKDLLLALRVDGGPIEADTPISATVRAEVGPDAAPLSLEGQVVIGAGVLVDPHEPISRLRIDEAQVGLRWDAAHRLLTMPIEISAGADHVSLLGQLEPPGTRGKPWGIAITGGRIELSSLEQPREPPLVLDRIAMRGRIDPAGHRIEVEKAEIAGSPGGVTFAGVLDSSGTEPRLTGSLIGTPMTAAALKQMWPPFVVTKVRTWVDEHVLAGSVERMTMSVNAPLNTLRPGGPPVPDDGLSVEINASGTVLQPFKALPAIRDADMAVRVVGRAASVKVGHGTYVLAPSGRKFALSNGVFEVADMQPTPPYSRTRFRVDGTVDGAAEFLSLPSLRNAAAVQLDPATSRGTFAAQVSLGMPVGLDLVGTVAYAVEADISNLAVEHMVRGQKLEANAVHVSANPQGVQLKGDVRIGGTPISIDYKKPVGDADAEVAMRTTLDDAARARFSADLGPMLGGPIPVKLSGRVGAGDHESRFTVDCDLLQAKITDLLPGWVKSPGKPSRATFTFVDKGRTYRLEDLVVDGPGTQVKGTVEIDPEGDVVLANFPIFALSDGDKSSLKAERAPDGTMKVTMRGDVYDGRGFVKGAMSGPGDENAKPSSRDVDLDIKVGALVGFNGEALRNVDLHMARRNGQIRSFGLNAKVGRDSTLLGDLRAYSNGRQVVFFQTNDAGALFRLTDTYPRIVGGQMWIAMDPPSAEQTPQDGHLSVSNFIVRGEPALERIVGGSTAPSERGERPQPNNGVEFTEMRVNFTKSPGRLAIRDGVVRGAAVGATLEGHIDYSHDDVRMHGTFVPAYALNNMFAQVPGIGFFLGGGQKEGLIGITYEVVGSPHAPTLRVNPMSAMAPGFLRKPFEFRGQDEGFSQQGNQR
ncbi:MAG TPA: hypothetical protein VGZ49_08795 [Xanthobacteraceae bacterium]|jgi:hypothetical protein|nr:hypothetical protein [Xanthobacteraceae bacterium]